MRLLKNLFLFCSLGLSGILHSQEKYPTSDLTDFDISGVKLGMSVAETISALKTRFNVDDNEIEVMRYDPSTVYKVRYKQDDIDLAVTFSTFVSLDELVSSHVSKIIFRSNDSRNSIIDEATHKIGKPSFEEKAGTGTNYFWCTKLKFSGNNASCNQIRATLSIEGESVKLHTVMLLELPQVRERAFNSEPATEPYLPEKLYSHPANQRQSPSESTDSVAGSEACPGLWGNFVDWYSRAHILDKDLTDEDIDWFNSAGFVSSYRYAFAPKAERPAPDIFYHLNIAPALSIRAIAEAAIVCDSDKKHPYPTRFIILRYLDKNGALGQLYLRKGGKHKYSVHFSTKTDNNYMQHAVSNNFFKPVPENFQSQVAAAKAKLLSGRQ
jgi:hypothetical protein